MRCLSTNSKAVVYTAHYCLFPPIMYCIVALAFTGNFRHYRTSFFRRKKNAEVADIKLYDKIATTSQR